jgi:periplasmic protein CpxP/Spy
MTYIKNNKALVFIIAILLLSNIALLYFFTRTRKECNKAEQKKEHKSFREQMADKLKNQVGFTDSQVNQYNELSGKHKEAMKPLFEDLTNAKDSLYKLLLQPQPSDSMKSYYLSMIGQKQQGVDQRIFNHFYTLREICTPEQRPKYDSVIQNVIKGWISFPNKKDKDKDKKKDK